MKCMKIGVLGCSSVANKSMIPAINACECFVLSGVSSRDPDKSKLYADKFSTKAYSYEEILNSDVDVIYVSLPVGLHYVWGKKILESGKNLLMEKTFTRTHEEAKELFDIARRNNLVCMEALMYEYHPLQFQIDNLLLSAGEVKTVEAHFGFPHFKDTNNIRYSGELGGGAMLDSLIYPLSFVFRILGNDFKNFNSISFHDNKHGVDERGYIQFEYKNAIANISYGLSHSYRNEVAVWTENMMLKADRVFSRPKECKNPIELVYDGDRKMHKCKPSDHFVNMLRAFYTRLITPSTHDIARENTLIRLNFIDKMRTANYGLQG